MNDITAILLAALGGGILCVIAQLLLDLTSLTPARILVGYVVLGVFLYAVGIYDPLFEIFGEGVSLPLIGFGAVIGRGVREAIIESGAIGIVTGGLTASAAGITVALLFGLLASLITKGKPKRL
ncbi:MAG: SpoVA/SpoVAEb family sporulation membrane protein [Clostridia bacterium]|nr:SpoVA/SpoVAEb family sporulation membrane protein [Clostridia bacterium]